MNIQTPPAPMRPWLLQQRTGTGLFVVSQAGTLLCRLDPTGSVLYLWDKKAGREIAVTLADLGAAGASPSGNTSARPPSGQLRGGEN